MTSTTTFGGYNVDGKQSSKVLKPPGGGSSDIFGAGEETPVRRVKNHQASKLVLEDGSALSTPSRSTGKDTHSRLFGPPPPTPPPPARARSNILDNGNPRAATTEVDGSNNHQTDQNEPAPTNGNITPPVTNGNPTPARTRVPPGGYSSGLW